MLRGYTVFITTGYAGKSDFLSALGDKLGFRFCRHGQCIGHPWTYP